MLLFEAKSELESRIRIKSDFGNNAPEYFEALKIAVKCIDMQMEMTDFLCDWDAEMETKRGDIYSPMATRDMIRQFNIYSKFDDDGYLLSEEEANNEK